MSVPRITEILEDAIQKGLDSKDEATRTAAASAAVAFASLKELKKIRRVLEEEYDVEISDDDIEDECEELI